MSPPMTQTSGVSTQKYAWVILFQYNINVSSPFSIAPLSCFAGSDFPWQAVEGKLSTKFRKERRKISNLPGDEYLIFAKVELGMFLYTFY